MGYYSHISESDFTILKENIPAMLEKLEMDDAKKFFEDNYFSIRFDDEGNITDIDCDDGKRYDDDGVFADIAPFVEAGSYVQYLGEDGESWRFVFDGKTCKEKKARLVFDD